GQCPSSRSALSRAISGSVRPLEQPRHLPVLMPGPENALGPLLRWVIAQRGWTQWRFAEQTGVDRSWVTRALLGHRDPAFTKVIDVLNQAGYKLVLVDDPPNGDGSNVHRRRFLVELGSVVGATQLGVAVPLAYGTGDLCDTDEVTAAAQ